MEAVTLQDCAAGSAFLAGLSSRAGLPPAPSVGSVAPWKTSPGTWQEPSAPSKVHEYVELEPHGCWEHQHWDRGEQAASERVKNVWGWNSGGRQVLRAGCGDTLI